MEESNPWLGSPGPTGEGLDWGAVVEGPGCVPQTHPYSVLDTSLPWPGWGAAPHPMKGLRGAQVFLDDQTEGSSTGPQVCFHL